jgi:hypothetical protein
MDITNTTTAQSLVGETSAPVKFTQEEISELTAIREAYEQATIGLGQLEMQKRELAKGEKRLAERLANIETQEKAFLDKIVATYGEGTFDINTGLFTPRKKQ